MTANKEIQTALEFSNLLRTKAVQTGPDAIAVDPLFEEDPKAAKVVEYAIKHRKNLFVVGPTGCGKSSLVINVAARLGERMEIVSMDGETSTDNLIGKLLLSEQNGQSVTTVAYGPVLRAYKEGKLLLLEEVDVANPDILAAMHRILELQSGFYVANIGAQEIIPKHARFACIATANTTGWGEDTFMYAGTKPLNQAFMNRFSLTVKMDYLKKNKEISVLCNKTGIKKSIATVMVQVANEVREARKSSVDRVAATVSTRDLLEWADAVVGLNMDPKEAAEYAFLNRISETDRDTIAKFISNRF